LNEFEKTNLSTESTPWITHPSHLGSGQFNRDIFIEVK